MAAWIIMVTLAAFGALSALWALFGFLLPAQRGAAAVCLCRPHGHEDGIIRRYQWLWNTGLIRCPLLLVDCGLTQNDRAQLLKYKHVIICTPEALASLLEQERDQLG